MRAQQTPRIGPTVALAAAIQDGASSIAREGASWSIHREPVDSRRPSCSRYSPRLWLPRQAWRPPTMVQSRISRERTFADTDSSRDRSWVVITASQRLPNFQLGSASYVRSQKEPLMPRKRARPAPVAQDRSFTDSHPDAASNEKRGKPHTALFAAFAFSPGAGQACCRSTEYRSG